MTERGPWIMTQTWEHLLFLHWEVEAEKLAALIPKELELDLYDGAAWVTILPFKVTNQRFHWLPEIPLLNTYLELNVRTYVKYRGVQGVYFFSLDANHPLAVLGAKALSLPYRMAKMEMISENPKIFFKSERRFEDAVFSAVYEPASAFELVLPESLDHWLLERYCLFTKWGNVIIRGDIRHDPWKVCEPGARIEKNSAAPFELGVEPALMHYSFKKKAIIFPFKKV